MAEDLVSVYIHLNNIPASPEQPFELYLEGNQVFENTEAIPAEQQAVIEAQIPRPKIAESHKVHIRYSIPAKGLDDVHQLNLTDHGEHILIQTSGSKVVIKQRNDDNFGSAGDHVVETEEVQHEGYTFKKAQLNTKKAPEVSIISSENTFTSLFLHLANIPASKQEPFVVQYQNKNLILKQEPMALNRHEVVEVKLQDPKIADEFVINLKISINALGIEAKPAFNLTKSGNHIQIATTDGENVRILQRKDENFDKLPWISPSQQAAQTNKGAGSSLNTGAPAPTTVAGGKTPITIYIEGAQASITKPFQLFVNGNIVYTLKNDLTEGQIGVVTVDLSKPPGNQDLIAKVGFRAFKQGFKETQEHTLNVTQHGAYIKFNIHETVKYLSFAANVEQSHQPFQPGQKNAAATSVPAGKHEEKPAVVTEESRKLSSFIKMSKPGLGTAPTPAGAAEPVQTKPAPAPTSTTKPAPAPAPAPAASKPSLGLEDLERLADLRDKGILTEAEFQAKKKQILGL